MRSVHVYHCICIQAQKWENRLASNLLRTTLHFPLSQIPCCNVIPIAKHREPNGFASSSSSFFFFFFWHWGTKLAPHHAMNYYAMQLVNPYDSYSYHFSSVPSLLSFLSFTLQPTCLKFNCFYMMIFVQIVIKIVLLVYFLLYRYR
jgi:hypothetical protein